MSSMQALLTVGIIAGATFLTRAAAFILFPGNRQTPAYIRYLGVVLPCATIGMLIVYCLKDVVFTAYPYGLPEIRGIAVVAVLQYWRRNTLLSIAVGTVLYMVLVQVVF